MTVVLAHWGSVLATPVGLLVGGVFGGTLMLIAALLFDRTRLLWPYRDRVWPDPGLEAHERAFLIAAFALMGHIAKADGRVSEQEVEAARVIMGELGLSLRERRRAVALFTRGKNPALPFRSMLWLLRLRSRRVSDRERLLGLLVRIARAGGAPSPQQRTLLDTVRRTLGLEQALLRRLLLRNENRPVAESGLRRTLGHAYTLLGVSETATDEEVKRAYRRAISRHHPDRQVAAGADEAEVQAAAQRTHEIREAYEEIRRARNM